MKAIRLTAIYLLLPLAAVGQEVKLAELKTLDGKSYTQVTIRKVEPDGLSILHESGTAKVSFEKLSKEIQKQYGYDPEKAKQHSEKLALAEASAEARLAAAEDAADVARSEKSATEKNQKDDAAFRGKVKAIAKKMTISGHQISDIGVIGTIHVYKAVTKEVPGSMLVTNTTWIPDQKFDGVMAGAAGVKAQKIMNIRPNGQPTTYETDIRWEGKAWKIGNIQYLTQQGLLRTCPLFTGSENEAVDFFRKNGLALDSQKFVKKAD